MGSNWLDLRACAAAFGGLCVLGVWYGMAGGDSRITGGLFIAAYAIAVVGVLWNVVLFAIRNPERRRQRWTAQGRCPSCGYDLNGNQSGVCPECGTRIWD